MRGGANQGARVNPLDGSEGMHGRRLPALKPVPPKQRDRARAISAERGGGRTSHRYETDADATMAGYSELRTLPPDIKDSLEKAKDEMLMRVKSASEQSLEQIRQAALAAFNPSISDPGAAKLNKLNSETSQLDVQSQAEYYKFRNLSGGYGHFADRLMYLNINRKIWPLVFVTAPLPAVISFVSQVVLLLRLWESMGDIYVEDPSMQQSTICEADPTVQVVAIIVFFATVLEQVPGTIKNGCCVLFAPHYRTPKSGHRREFGGIHEYQLAFWVRMGIFAITVLPDMGTTIFVIVVGVKYILMATEVAGIIRASLFLTFIIRIDEIIVKLMDAYTHKVRTVEYETPPVVDDKAEEDMPLWFLLTEISSAILVLPCICITSLCTVLLMRQDPYVDCDLWLQSNPPLQ
uniref:Uncharacterized protein n=1 Tax=Hemiselmis tepida TaxID=464990 RepID=A0A7S0VFK7_9CRYP|mmetsp:Transcript_13557/g.34716  ORF Transcript_13557/g.34716 Transcript_13557/m.34716 type:complete len:406 (+) Transcript_13557:208-1425(+)|eukprot:CAMPEP_0174917620 /NCGR_PEP_ID=MMETSP1355-20121228/2578_1 /TAXON_ID=464990 /ORGANISM="Hemiselmis tepida, Strain CCMP443" /LENGTH=405 /DNA_ID=CAMNT_0016162731 /DNA_START=121 /DNA_END=1338 /DNA_ORIENTATION=-